MRLVGNNVLIKPDLKEKSTGGVYYNLVKKASTGTIVDVGPRCEEAKKDLKVHYASVSASQIVIDGVNYDFIDEQHITFLYT